MLFRSKWWSWEVEVEGGLLGLKIEQGSIKRKLEELIWQLID